MWEVMTFAQKPFESLSDFRFVEFALNETDELANEIGKLRVLVSHLKNKIIYSRYNRLCTKYRRLCHVWPRDKFMQPVVPN